MKNHDLKTPVLLVLIITIIFLSGITKGAQDRELTIEDLLRKGRMELTNDHLNDAIFYFSKALEKCQPGIDAYDVQFTRCNFFMGEGYFQKFQKEHVKDDAETAIKYFEVAVKAGERVTPQQYVSDGQMRILQLKQALAQIDTGITEGQGPAYRVRAVVKGLIISKKWQIYLGNQRLDNPFVDVFSILDKSNEIAEEKRRAVYISEPTASDVCKYIGVSLSEEAVTPQYGNDNVLNIAEAYRKLGYPEIVLRNGEKWNGYWAIIEFDLMNAMPAIPVYLFEHFGATVNIDWTGQRVTITTKDTSKPIVEQPKPTVVDTTREPSDTITDWFKITNAPLLPPQGAGGDWIIGFHEFQMPEKIYPGQLVQGKVSLRIKDSAKNSAGAVIYISLFGDWLPNTEIARVYDGLVGEPRLISIPFSFTAPPKQGTYHLRCPMVLAFAPVKNYFGSKPIGQNDPGVGPYIELSFSVSEVQATEPAQSQVEDKGPIETTKKYLTALWNHEYDKVIEMVSDDIWFFHRDCTLGHGRESLKKDYEVSKQYPQTKYDAKILNIVEEQGFEGGNISRVRVTTQIPVTKDNQRIRIIWLKKIDNNWLLFSPPLSLAGYSESDVQEAVKGFFDHLNKNNNNGFSNITVKNAVIEYDGQPDTLLMDVSYTDSTRSETFSDIAAIIAKRENMIWTFGGMYSGWQVSLWRK